MLQSTTTLAAALLIYAAVAALAAEPCPMAAEWSETDAAAYLTDDLTSRTDSCTAAALTVLAAPGNSPDPALLAGYVGFLRPDLTGLNMLTIENVEDLCPAVRALVAVGPRALPALLASLKKPLDEHVRRNTVRTVKLIFKRDSVAAMQYLLEESRKEAGQARERLESAAELNLVWCNDAEIATCREIFESNANRDKPRWERSP